VTSQLRLLVKRIMRGAKPPRSNVFIYLFVNTTCVNIQHKRVVLFQVSGVPGVPENLVGKCYVSRAENVA
jgi:hypothetical protein